MRLNEFWIWWCWLRFQQKQRGTRNIQTISTNHECGCFLNLTLFRFPQLCSATSDQEFWMSKDICNKPRRKKQNNHNSTTHEVRLSFRCWFFWGEGSSLPAQVFVTKNDILFLFSLRIWKFAEGLARFRRENHALDSYFRPFKVNKTRTLQCVALILASKSPLQEVLLSNKGENSKHAFLCSQVALQLPWQLQHLGNHPPTQEIRPEMLPAHWCYRRMYRVPVPW